MVSNYFTKPGGLNPTPQICFPSAPSPPVGNKTWFFSLAPVIHQGLGTTIFHLDVQDPSSPFGLPIPFSLSVPGLQTFPPYFCPNFGQFNGTLGIPGPPGSYNYHLQIHWPDGSTSNGNGPYVIVFP